MTSPPDLFDEPPPGPGFIERWAEGRGLTPVLGVDEAGRGCLAGPVVAAAVLLPPNHDIEGIDDSKRLTHATRERLADRIHATSIVGVGMVSANRIDATNILAASLEAMRQAVEIVRARSPGPIGIVIVDGNQAIPGLDMHQRPWPKGDGLSLACGAASIVAKVTRDRLMVLLDSEFPGYGFARHKGYGTAVHLEALARLGACPAHRKTFAPVTAVLLQNASSINVMSGRPSRQATAATKKRTSS
jgi:ribonuclease HII